ncbi:MAG TPA: FumA C-terminus/TtdB family hydratase beta subunit [Candidatus Cloacimonadota bacterium]|nr:FumA C-terminus/TtdB family hydratase beta subunit [Candidatus Cloacimonadota bacterium]HQL15374.1 FumA C-terminus/TtdB family hydratase beta subunit [Candidatus Cloacimonadota bacterium]
MKTVELTLPLTASDLRKELTKGTKVLFNGVVYTARDEAHKRIVACLEEGKDLPFDLKQAAIFYAGPAPAKKGQICGAIGPTTSARMDKYTPALLAAGVKVLIGKGEPSPETEAAIRKYGAIYLAAIGGASALLTKCVTSCELTAWPELGPEAVYKLEVKNFPCYVVIV